MGLGAIALNELLGSRANAADGVKIAPGRTPWPPAREYPAKVKNVIYLFMAGGP